MRCWSIVVLVLACLGQFAAAQDSSALINKELDSQVKLTVNDVLPRAMDAIKTQTGVRLDADPAVWDLLPWGQDTNISAQIENKTLREALELITRKLGLTFALKDESIEIQPMPALRRLARRASVHELQALDLMASTPAELKTDRPTFKQLLEAVDGKLADLKSPFAIENRSGNTIRPDTQIAVPRNATLMDALESIAKETSITWYPWGKSIVVIPKEDRIRAMLGKTLTVRYNSVDVLQVLMELSARSGVPFEIQPGAVQAVPADARNIRGVFENAAIQQILEAISGATGLIYAVKDESVAISSAGAGPAGRDPLVGIIQLDNGVQILLPTSQVPPDVREYLRVKAQKQIDTLRQRMAEEGFKPTTRPE